MAPITSLLFKFKSVVIVPNISGIRRVIMTLKEDIHENSIYLFSTMNVMVMCYYALNSDPTSVDLHDVNASIFDSNHYLPCTSHLHRPQHNTFPALDLTEEGRTLSSARLCCLQTAVWVPLQCSAPSQPLPTQTLKTTVAA